MNNFEDRSRVLFKSLVATTRARLEQSRARSTATSAADRSVFVHGVATLTKAPQTAGDLIAHHRVLNKHERELLDRISGAS
jgi:hypothetical protein